MNLVLLDPAEVDADRSVTLADGRGTHLREILRVTPGQHVRIGLVDGPHGTGTVAAVDATGVRLHCTFEEATPGRPRVDLLLALPRPKVMRRLWAQLAAIGVGRIVLTNAARVERHYFDTHLLAAPGYRPLLIEGLQQARDTRLPPVTIHKQFRKLVEDELDRLCPDSIRVMADPGAGDRVGAVIGPPLQAGGGRVLLAIGPEGGWNAFERRLLGEHGFVPVSMGPRTLATSTACLALLALVHDALR